MKTMKLEEAVKAMADDVSAGLELQLLQACELRLGEKVDPEELCKRLAMTPLPNGAGDLYYLDGQQLAFVGPIEVVDTDHGMSASRLFIRYKADGTVERNAAAAANDEPTQYQRDLAVLQREEERIVEQGGCPADIEFFGAMGQVQRDRGEGGNGQG